MGVLDEIISKEQAPAAKPAGKRESFPSATTDNAGRISILQSELEQERNNSAHPDPEVRKRALSNMAAISREIAAINGQKMPAQQAQPVQTPQAAPQPTGGVLDEIIQKEMPAAVGAPVGRSEQDMVGADNTNKPLYPRENKMLPPVEVTDTFLPMTDFGKGIAAVIDNTVGGILPFATKQGSYLIGRTISDLGRITGVGETKTPEQIDEESNRLASIFSQPIGKIFGIDPNDPAYKGEAVGRFFELLGENTKESAQNIRLDLQRKGVDISEKDIEFLINSILPKVAEKVGVPVGKAVEKVGQAVEPVVAPVANKVTNAAQALKDQFAAKGGVPPTTRGSAGAAATTNAATIQQALSVATPELQAIIKDIPIDKVNLPTLTRHIEADTLPIPIRLTEGQATGDVVKLSNEQNRRGKDTQLAQRFNEQNQQLTENLGAIREIAAPDVYGTKTIENSQSLIDAYKALDEQKSIAIGEAYKKLTDANGGTFPVDGVKIATDASALLSKNLKSEFVPAPIRRQLRQFESGQPMNFEQFEAMRTNIAAETRKAERAGDGNAAMALSLVRQAMENLPLAKGVGENLKGLADNARLLAKQRFDAIKADPAYKAAINDVVPADKFIDKFVINGVHKNIETMINTLGRDSQAHQHMAAGTVNWLKDKAGIVDESGNFSQAGFNKALKKLDDVNNLNAIFNPEASTQLKNLGNVARYTQFQPRGSFVNNSNTLVGALANHAAGAVETGANVMMGGKYGIPIGSIVRGKIQEVKAGKETEKSLAPGAGIRGK
jgi:hypothetical protein